MGESRTLGPVGKVAGRILSDGRTADDVRWGGTDVGVCQQLGSVSKTAAERGEEVDLVESQQAQSCEWCQQLGWGGQRKAWRYGGADEEYKSR
jgi:hypothetical protein